METVKSFLLIYDLATRENGAFTQQFTYLHIAKYDFSILRFIGPV